VWHGQELGRSDNTTLIDTRVPDPKPAQALALPEMAHPSKAMRAVFRLPILKQIDF